MFRIQSTTLTVWRHKGSYFQSQAPVVRPTCTWLCQVWFSPFPPRLFLSLFLTLVQKDINLKVKWNLDKCRSGGKKKKKAHIFIGRLKHRTSVTLGSGTCPCDSRRNLSISCSTNRSRGRRLDPPLSSSRDHRGFAAWASPLASPKSQPWSHSQPQTRSENSPTCCWITS